MKGFRALENVLLLLSDNPNQRHVREHLLDTQLIFAGVFFGTFLIGLGGTLGCIVIVQKQSDTIHLRSGENANFDFWPRGTAGKL